MSEILFTISNFVQNLSKDLSSDLRLTAKEIEKQIKCNKLFLSVIDVVIIDLIKQIDDHRQLETELWREVLADSFIVENGKILPGTVKEGGAWVFLYDMQSIWDIYVKTPHPKGELELHLALFLSVGKVIAEFPWECGDDPKGSMFAQDIQITMRILLRWIFKNNDRFYIELETLMNSDPVLYKNVPEIRKNMTNTEVNNI